GMVGGRSMRIRAHRRAVEALDALGRDLHERGSLVLVLPKVASWPDVRGDQRAPSAEDRRRRGEPLQLDDASIADVDPGAAQTSHEVDELLARWPNVDSRHLARQRAKRTHPVDLRYVRLAGLVLGSRESLALEDP